MQPESDSPLDGCAAKANKIQPGGYCGEYSEAVSTIEMVGIQVSRVNDAQGLSAWRDQWQELFKTDAHQDLACSYAWFANGVRLGKIKH